MTESELDSTKNSNGKSRNVSCFNLNQDMLNRADWNGNRDDLQNVIQCLLKWLRGEVRYMRAMNHTSPLHAITVRSHIRLQAEGHACAQLCTMDSDRNACYG